MSDETTTPGTAAEADPAFDTARAFVRESASIVKRRVLAPIPNAVDFRADVRRIIDESVRRRYLPPDFTSTPPDPKKH